MFAVFAFLPVILILVILFINRGKIEGLQELSERFGGGIFSRLVPTFQGNYGGLTFRVVLIRPRYSAPLLKIYLYHANYLRAYIFNTRVYFLFRWIRKMGLIKPVKIDDPVFDKDFFVISTMPGSCKMFLNKPEVKASITELFEEGFERLFLNSRSIFIQKPNYMHIPDLDKDYIESVARRLSVLARAL